MSSAAEVPLDELVWVRRLLTDRVAPSEPPSDVTRRLADALLSGSAGPLDFASLIRQFLRRVTVSSGVEAEILVPSGGDWPGMEHWARVGCVAVSDGPQVRVRTSPWSPDWLDSPKRGVDNPAVAVGYAVALRQPVKDRDILADPWFVEAMGEGFERYTSPGQQQATRAIVAAPPGSTVICGLPTGSGKTETVLAPALSDSRAQVTLFIVPTISLALDLDARLSQLAAKGRLTPGPFAYVSHTPPDDKGMIRERIGDGSQRFVITSPESASGSLQMSLRRAARSGHLRFFVVDEAHLVREWGQDFRPDLPGLVALRDRLLDDCQEAGHKPFVTVALSATLTDVDVDLLSGYFGQPGPIAVVIANALRPEPDYYVARSETRDERRSRVLEALLHAPKPAILYTSLVADADAWEVTLQDAGLRRVGVVTGSRAGDERAEVMSALRGDSRPTGVDIVVATAAFGLGISYGALRTVIHACLPETIDRLYQEVGRAGRDGSASLELLLWTPADQATQSRLARTTVLDWDTAMTRWEAMWLTARPVPDGHAVNLDIHPSRLPSSTVHDHQWNMVTLMMLRRAGLIDLDAHTEPPSEEGEDRWRREVVVSKTSLWNLTTEETWRTFAHGEKARSRTADLLRQQAVQRLLSPETRVCETLADSYTLSAGAGLGSYGLTTRPEYGCGQCPVCRVENRRLPRSPRPLPPNLPGPSHDDLPVLVAWSGKDRTWADSAEAFGQECIRRGVVAFIVDSEMRDSAVLKSAHRETGIGYAFVDDFDDDRAMLPKVSRGAILPRSTTEIPRGWLIPPGAPFFALVSDRSHSPWDRQWAIVDVPPEGCVVLSLDDFLEGAG